ncbi:uncharacterized protein LOC118425365 [Branchiostoma floridae]|uniref:Uncharacterized protein LOC118425365 n=1 Tax=Branchiostoma floridae TaxID=7739 RepID=A0A9J7N368_BRAFL|nr:uncharacterized protein LOC118425365 [Branchiostoma floridae]
MVSPQQQQEDQTSFTNCLTKDVPDWTGGHVQTSKQQQEDQTSFTKCLTKDVPDWTGGHVQTSKYEDIDRENNQATPESNTNTTAAVVHVTCDHVKTGNDQSQAITEPTKNTAATVMTSGYDQTGQGQSQAITEPTKNTAATVMTSGYDQAGQGQSQQSTDHGESLDTRNPIYTTEPAASEGNHVYNCENDQAGKDQTQANADESDGTAVIYATEPAASEGNPVYNCENNQAGKDQTQANADEMDGKHENMWRKLNYVLVFLLIILKEPNMAEAGCRSRCEESSSSCHCYKMDLTNIPQDLPTSISRLNLYSNKITTLNGSELARYGDLTQLEINANQINVIQTSALSNVPKLTKLSISSNQIRNIQPGAFSNVPKLTELYLKSNLIIILHPGVFSNVPNLTTLFLGRNLIRDIQRGTLSNLLKLTHLSLKSNRLSDIQADILFNLPKLEWLDLRHNQITDIQSGTFSNLPKLKQLLLQSNSISVLPLSAYCMLASIPCIEIAKKAWQCDCRMASSRKKMNGSLPFENHFICSKPDFLFGQRFKDINPKDLNCVKSTVSIVSGQLESINNSYKDTTYQASHYQWCFKQNAGSAAHSVGNAFTPLPVDPSNPETEMNNSHESVPILPLPVLIVSVCGPIAVIALIGAVILTIWYKRRTKNPPSGQNTTCSATNTTTCSATVVTNDHDPQYKDIDRENNQATPESNTNTTAAVQGMSS